MFRTASTNARLARTRSLRRGRVPLGKQRCGVAALLAAQDAADRKEQLMPNEDEMKGRVKKAAGDLTGDNDLHREGEADETAGKLKGAIDDVADKAKDAVDRD